MSKFRPLTRNSIRLRNLSDEERLELAGLKRKYPFPDKTATKEQKMEASIALQAALDARNVLYKEYKLNKQLVNRFCDAEDVGSCIQWIDREDLKNRIKKDGVSDPLINEGFERGEACSQRVIDLFASQLGGLKVESEGEVEKLSGFYLKGFVTGNGLITKQLVCP